jgi:hypothetical protein
LARRACRVEPHWAAIPELFQAQLERYRFLERTPRDARVRFVNGVVEVIPSQSGQTLELEPSLQNLLTALRELPAAQTRFELAMRPTPPRIPTEAARAITGVDRQATRRAFRAIRSRAITTFGWQRARSTGVSCCLASVSRTIKRSASARSSMGSAPRL